MAKIPRGISIQKSRKSVTLTTSNYSDPLYLMQVMLFIPFLSIVSVLYLIYSPFWLLFSLPLLAATIRWTYYNKKDHYKIYLNNKQLIVTKGMNKLEIINTDLHSIRDVYIVKITERVPGKFKHDPIIDNKNELVVETSSDRIVITNSLIDSEQVFIQNKILGWIKEHRIIISIDDVPSQDSETGLLHIE
ncbi:MAG: hypothetical protein JWM14_3276 [Chitinophagaceae bacterium]|nr:hypothetical protein [Chitinophagaceae bacterium]